jgi:hypothetical protein
VLKRVIEGVGEIVVRATGELEQIDYNPAFMKLLHDPRASW